MKDLPEIKVGQVWADNDKREKGRTVKALAIIDRGGDHHVSVEVLTVRGGHKPPKPRQSRIAQRRFVPNGTGYRLIQDVPGGD